MDRDIWREGAVGAGEPTPVHVNGIYIKAAQISSWVLNVRGSKKPFRHAASLLIVKIEGALGSCSCGSWRGSAVLDTCRHHFRFYPQRATCFGNLFPDDDVTSW